MKKSILFLLLSIFSVSVLAQKTKVYEVTEYLGGSKNPGFAVTILEADEDLVEKEWKALLKGYGADKSSKGGQIIGRNARIGSISGTPVNIFATIKERSKTETYFAVAFMIDSVFFNPSTDKGKAEAIKSLVYNFAVKTTKLGLQEQIKREDKELIKLGKQFKTMQEDKAALEKDIESYKEKIKKAEQDIEINIKDQAVKTKDMDLQKKIVEDLKVKESKVD